jgi:flavin-dependent dehydrogenase
MEPDVLVVGAGPAGAAVSILLAPQSYRVLLVHRATFPRDKACAEYLRPACTPLLATARCPRCYPDSGATTAVGYARD